MCVWCECSSGFGNSYLILMTAASFQRPSRRGIISAFVIAMMLSVPIISIDGSFEKYSLKDDIDTNMNTQEESDSIWIDGGQPWPQSGRTATRIADVPDHSPDGGAGFGDPANSSSLMSVVRPAINWEFGSYSIGTDSLSTPIAEMSGSIEIGPGAEERCGGSSLFTVLVQSEDVAGSEHSILRLIEGEDAELAWQVDLGVTEKVKASPVVVDIDEDGSPEVVVAYDAGGSMYVDVWSPRMYCSVTGWTYSGHSEDLLWTWSDEALMISSEEGPYTSGILGGHKPTTQPLLADLDLDGDAELVIAALDEISEEPVVLALPLQTSGSPNALWQVSLSKGSHPSDPAFAQVDDDTGYVLLTTIEANNGGMWVWKIDSDTGSSIWQGGLSLNNLDGDTNSPHVRLPGPIIANLDSDSDPEIIVTIPSDADGSTAVDGAEFRGMEISDGSQLWEFEATNGFADAPPAAIDTDGDGVHDRVCWNTWWQTTTDRQGAAGCHDVGGTVPNQEWAQDLEQSSGNPNDEIAVAAPVWMNIDSEDEPELLVSYGRSLWAFDGSSGSPAGINSEWSNDVELSHRTWSSPAIADMDGDATADIVLGSMVVSMAMPDIRPITDGRGIEFNPSAPDPGEEVTVTVYIENAGTADTEEVVDVAIFANGEKIGGQGIEVLNPVDPTGSGSFASFNVEWSGGLGEHTFELIVDPYRNLSQTRFDNDKQVRSLSIIPTYNATFEIPTEPIRVDPGGDAEAGFGIRSTGRLAGTWSLDVDSTSLPNGWTWQDETPGGITSIEIGVGQVWTPSLKIIAPSGALGSDAGFLALTLSRDGGDEEISANLPVEANRTRGLSIRGPDGTTQSTGFGLVSEDARAWLLIENVGNADESQIAISWDGTEWGSDLRIFDSSGYEISALTLGPGEEREVTARLSVPSGTAPGESVTTPLSMCVGAGDEQECSLVQLEFIASRSVMDPSHIRSVPEQGLTWDISADIPEGVGAINWSLSDSGMSIQGWDWSGAGQVSVSGDVVSITGDSGTRAIGSLTLDLPEDARPSFHLFEDDDSEISDSPLSISIEVLQIHRAGMDVNSPTMQPYVVEVEESNLVVLKLENPGNGDDSYMLSHEILLDENMTSDPGIIVSFSSNPVHLGAGSLRTVPLSVTLPESTPARVPIAISFTMTSQGNDSVHSHEVIVFEVRQDHRWDFDLIHDGEDVNGTKIFLAPGEGSYISINATNTGNLVDDISLDLSTQIFPLGSDSSEGWIANGSSIEGVEVNESVSLEINLGVPEDSWNGSIMRVDVTGMARDESILEFHFMVEVTRVPGWGVSSSISDLEVEANGSTIQIEIMQMGNNPSVPFVSTYITGQNGWLIGDLPQLPEVVPGDSTTLEINITPSEDASPGRSVELHVRVRDGDSAGLTEITMPLRVSAVRDFSIGSHGSWAVSSLGGKPPAMVSNTGNSPTTIDFRVEGVPDGWSVSGSMQIVLALGEQRGLPINLVPEEGWTGPSETVRIVAQDASGNERQIELEVRYSEFSWASSPYIFAQNGDDATINIHGTDEGTDVLDRGSRLEWSEMGWLLPVTDSTNGTLLIEGEELGYFLSSEYSESRVVLCSITGDFDEMGAMCSVGNGTMGFDFQILLISDEGSVLDYFYGSLESNESAQQINMSGSEWKPLPGERSVVIRVLSEKGVLIGDFEREFDVRRSDWNVGIGEVELVGEGTGQQVSVPTKRLNENLLSDADCIISLSAEGKSRSHYSEHIVDMTQAFVPAPKFDRPDVEDSTELVITISCSFPWDIDSDPSDDRKTIVLSGGSALEDRVDELGTGLLAAILVVGSYLGLSWIMSNRRESERMMKMAQAAIDEKIAEKQSAPPIEEKEPERVEEPESSDDDEVEIIQNETEEGDEYDERLRRLLDR